MGGVGKSLLAIEYARRFGAAYPGGIFWLRAAGADPDTTIAPEARELERRRQIEDIALHHGIDIKDLDFRLVRHLLAQRLADRGAPYLWIVDDLPGGLAVDPEFHAWCAPGAGGRTLITTRSRDYDGIGATVPVDILDPAPALEEGDPFGDLLGDPTTVDGFFTAFRTAYELRDIAHRLLCRRPAGGVLDTTEVVHEAYLRLTRLEAQR